MDLAAALPGEAAPESPAAGAWKVLYYDYDYRAAEQRLKLARLDRHRPERIDKRLENLRRSQSWLARQSSTEAAQLLLAYLEELTPYLQQRELHVELLCWCKDALRACEQLQRPSGDLWLLCGQAHHTLGHWDEAIKAVQAAMESSPGEDPDLYARAMLALGQYHVAQGNYQAGLENMAQAARLSSQQAQSERYAAFLGEHAAYTLNKGDFDTALALYQQIDQMQRAGGAGESSDHTLLMLGVVYRRKRQYELAAASLQELRDRAKARQHQETLATASHHLSWVWLSAGKTSLARQHCGEALALYENVSNRRGLADAYEQLGAIALAERRNKEAVSCLERSLELRRQLGNKQGEASSLYRLALAQLGLGHPGAATTLLWQSLDTYRRLGVLSRQRLARVSWQVFSYILLGRRRWSA